MAPTPEKTTGKKNRSRSQADRTLFRTGTFFNTGFKTALYLRSRQAKTKHLHTPNFGKRPAFRKCTENEAVGSVRNCLATRGGVSTEREPRRNERQKFSFERIGIAVSTALDIASLSAI